MHAVHEEANHGHARAVHDQSVLEVQQLVVPRVPAAARPRVARPASQVEAVRMVFRGARCRGFVDRERLPPSQRRNIAGYPEKEDEPKRKMNTH